MPFPTASQTKAGEAAFAADRRAARLGKPLPSEGKSGSNESSTVETSSQTMARMAAEQKSSKAAVAATTTALKKQAVEEQAKLQAAQVRKINHNIKKIEKYMKRFPEKLAHVKVKTSYRSLGETEATLDQIRAEFNEIDGEAMVKNTYIQTANWIGAIGAQYGLKTMAFGAVIADAVTPDPLPGRVRRYKYQEALSDACAEVAIEHWDKFCASLPLRFLYMNVHLLYAIHTSAKVNEESVDANYVERVSRQFATPPPAAEEGPSS